MIINAQPNRLFLFTYQLVNFFPFYLPKFPNHLSCALSRLRLSGHNPNVKRLRQQQQSSLRASSEAYLTLLGADGSNVHSCHSWLRSGSCSSPLPPALDTSIPSAANAGCAFIPSLATAGLGFLTPGSSHSCGSGCTSLASCAPGRALRGGSHGGGGLGCWPAMRWCNSCSCLCCSWCARACWACATMAGTDKFGLGAFTSPGASCMQVA